MSFWTLRLVLTSIRTFVQKPFLFRPTDKYTDFLVIENY